MELTNRETTPAQQGQMHLLFQLGAFTFALPLAEVKELLDRWKLRPKTPKPPIQPPAPIPPHEAHEPADEPTIAEAPPSAVRGAEGMMNVPLPEPAGEDGQGSADRSRSGTR